MEVDVSRSNSNKKNGIEDDIENTRRRLELLGISEDELLDPDSDLDEQVAVLRLLYLQAERSCLPFEPEQENYWRIIRARLQPVILAYQAHEKFVRTLAAETKAMRAEKLLDLYKTRLANSDKFRSIFFTLDEKVKAPIKVQKEEEPNIPNTAPNTDIVQRNIIKSLEKQLQDLEKKYNKQEAALESTQLHNLDLESELKDRNEIISRLETQLNKIKDENVQLRLSGDAGRRQDSYHRTAEPNTVKTNDSLINADQRELVARIDALEKELAVNADAAYNAFVCNADLGIVVLFMLSSFGCKDHNKLGQELVKSITTFGLKAMVGIKTSDGMDYYFGSEVDAKLKLLLGNSFGSEPVIEEPHLMLFNNNLCILIEDPQQSDRERYLRLKDNLQTLLKGAQAQYDAILSAKVAERHRKQVDALIVRSNEVLQSFDKNLTNKHTQIANVVNMFGKDLRSVLDIMPGDEKSIRLNMELKKVEDGFKNALSSSELLDPAFVKNIKKVAESILKSKRR